MVGYAFAALYRPRVTRFVLIDAPLPGVGPWDEILKTPLLWHFRFGGPDMERLVKGRERIYLDRFWTEFSAMPKRFSEAARRHYAKLYARPGEDHVDENGTCPGSRPYRHNRSARGDKEEAERLRGAQGPYDQQSQSHTKRDDARLQGAQDQNQNQKDREAMSPQRAAARTWGWS
jgi:pimeloyl-ACP methyl ester carboxylesterase